MVCWKYNRESEKSPAVGDGGRHQASDKAHASIFSYRGRGRSSFRNNQCFYCQKYGHTIKICRRKIEDEKTKELSFMHEGEKKSEVDTLFLACSVEEIAHDEVWYIDSGCSNHMTGNKKVFVNLNESITSKVRISDDKILFVKRKSDILVQTKK